eukprot:637653-Prymnesium_polylepis.2
MHTGAPPPRQCRVALPCRSRCDHTIRQWRRAHHPATCPGIGRDEAHSESNRAIWHLWGHCKPSHNRECRSHTHTFFSTGGVGLSQKGLSTTLAREGSPCSAAAE